MKALLDMPVSRSLLSVLRAHGHDGVHAHEMRGLLNRVLEEVPPEILEISVCVVDRKRIRCTRLPLREEGRQ